MAYPSVTPEMGAEALKVLEEHDGNMTAAASSLGMSPSTLRNRIRRAKELYGQEAPAPDDRPQFPDFPDPDIPAEQILDIMEKRFEKRRTHEESKRWFNVKIPISGPFAIAWVGDPHLDANGCNIKLLREHVKLFADNREFVFAVNVGDTLDNWPKTGRMAALLAQSDTSEETAWRLAHWFLEDSNVNWLLWLLGNHDLWNDAGKVFKQLGTRRIPIEDWGARFKLISPNGESYKVWASHNFPGHSQWNSLHGPTKSALMQEQADIYVAGHTHHWALHTEEVAARGNVFDIVRARGYKYIDDYAARLGYYSQEYGASIVTVFNPDAAQADERLQTFKSPKMGIEFCRYLRSQTK